ncbi:MAG: D-alanyl-D-alanine carboxypeptidase [Acidobacteria bacterium]|nr:D-alanyl-D-alanine carboxypeptidase [Acidobacteriota bacterium]
MRLALPARRRIQFAGICALLLWSGTVGLAPHASRAAASAPPVPVPDPAHDPPRTLSSDGLPAPRLGAEAAVVYDPASHEILWESNSFTRRPIASITKVMTALVFLEQQPDLDADVVVSRRDVRRASTTYLRRGERVSLYNLLHLALVASDNVAARVLARVSPWGTRGFVEQMNVKATELGLRGTTFTDPSGLHSGNVSTAYDVSRLIVQATNRPVISTIMRKTSYSLRTSRRRLRVRNTNKLLQGRLLVHGGKTGYINASGYCLATVVKLPDREPLSIVVLGAGSNSRRFREVRRLADWVSEHGAALSPPTNRPAD